MRPIKLWNKKTTLIKSSSELNMKHSNWRIYCKNKILLFQTIIRLSVFIFVLNTCCSSNIFLHSRIQISARGGTKGTSSLRIFLERSPVEGTRSGGEGEGEGNNKRERCSNISQRNLQGE